MFAFVPYDISKVDDYIDKGFKTINLRQCYAGNSLYSLIDRYTIKKVFETAIKNNVAIHQDHTKVVSGLIYMVIWCDEETGTERGLSLFYCDEGAWFTQSDSKSLVEQLQIRFDNTRFSAGISRHTAMYLKSLVDKGVADRAIAGASSNDALMVKNSFEKLGYKTTYEFTYEKH